jgi:1-hydroxycarotenoid 3,4-desaturase
VSPQRVVIIGAGVGGLAAAIDLAGRGVDVTVLERTDRPGGKLREMMVADRAIDSGPTVFTMRWVFEELLHAAGTALERELTLKPAQLLARHAWSAKERLDLHVDIERSADAVSAFAGADEARRFRAFCRTSADVYRTLEGPFLRSSKPDFFSLTTRVGLANLPALLRLQPFTTLWRALGQQFRDPRLRQLYGRYATYCGSSPFLAPATLMLVAHVEQDGVWFVEGGMYRLVEALARVAARLGAGLRCDAEVAEIIVERGKVAAVLLAGGERIEADAVIVNADAGAVGSGLFGAAVAGAVAPVDLKQRSLSALAWSAVAKTSGFPLTRHSVFFSSDSRTEFDDIFRRLTLPADPTVYICAQDRDDDAIDPGGPERLLILVNAPAVGDIRPFEPMEIAACQERMVKKLADCGLSLALTSEATRLASPADFARLFPGTGGAIYGRASHGWRASFQRPDQRTAIPGLYLAGGSVHPGPGVPMAALSGRLAAQAVLSDLVSTSRSSPAAMSGGMSTR